MHPIIAAFFQNIEHSDQLNFGVRYFFQVYTILFRIGTGTVCGEMIGNLLSAFK